MFETTNQIYINKYPYFFNGYITPHDKSIRVNLSSPAGVATEVTAVFAWPASSQHSDAPRDGRTRDVVGRDNVLGINPWW